MFIFTMIMNLYLSMMFIFLNHPMSMGLIIIMQTIMIALITGMYSYTFWFSYILFLIMIGGMLILFMYMTSLASNEKFKFSMKLILASTLIIFILLIMLFNDKSIINMMMKNSNMMEMLNNYTNFKNENLKSLNMMYNKPNYMITMIMINYLLITLIAVVKITKFNKGPLRQKF
uniref:NADH-ubiquinone oxidoreductase chain 6 n=1 Tax=Stictonectes samai TaxID=224507 RepID=A0A894JWW0_9DYTI|nr:NADH dehydrogenase subunit 6 [Stictonectes samai]